MDLRPEFQLKTAVRALTDVVLPAVDTGNKLAQEQVRLVIGMLGLLMQRLPLFYRYDRDELACSLKLAEELEALCGGQAHAAQALKDLAPSVAHGRNVHARAAVEPAELEATNVALRERIGTLVTALSSGVSADAMRPVSRVVLDHSKQQLLRERAWLAPQGWEPASSLPAVETLIAPIPTADEVAS